MAIRELPLRSDIAAYSFRVDLEGTFYTFAFAWNSRIEGWFFDIRLEDETPIIVGQPVLVNYALAERFKDERLPQGKLFFFDTSNKSLDPNRDDLGSRVLLFYEDSE
jgi:hypothetical protein